MSEAPACIYNNSGVLSSFEVTELPQHGDVTTVQFRQPQNTKRYSMMISSDGAEVAQ